MSKEKNLVIIDTDCGVDDALALVLALRNSEDWKVIAITCTHGNTALENACKNVLRVMNLCNITDIPVYAGFSKPFMSMKTLPVKYVYSVHGDDGFGNVSDEYPTGSLKTEGEHAFNALLRLVDQYKKQIHLIALAPLTTIAMVHRLDPNFLTNLKSLTVMGGSVRGFGNVNSAAEFNFYADPEAAMMVLGETQCPTTLIPWETALKHNIPWSKFEELGEQSNRFATFTKKVTSDLAKLQQLRGRKGFIEADVLAVLACIYPESITETERYPIYVETCGMQTRGVSIVCRRESTDENKPKINIVMTMNQEQVLKVNEKYIFGE